MTGETVPTIIGEYEIERVVSLLRDGIPVLGLGGLLTASALTQATPAPPIEGWHLAIGVVLLGLVTAAMHAVDQGTLPGWPVIIVASTATAILLVALVRFNATSFPVGGPAAAETAIILLALVGFVLVYPSPRAFTPWQWLLVGAAIAVVGLFLGHLHTVPLGSVAPTWPLWAGVVAMTCLVLLPRVIPEWAFLWTTASLATIASAISLGSVLVGEFTLLGFDVVITNQDIPILGLEIEAWNAHAGIFNNVNVMGLVAFAGVTAATILAVRSRDRHHRRRAIALAVVCGGALIASSSGAAWIAAGVALGFYATVLVAGRSVLPHLFALAAGGSLLVIALAYVADLPVDDSGRYIRWRSSLLAFRDDPSLLGHGHISTAAFIEEHLGVRGAGTPHNSYLSVLIRLGAVGGLLYGLLVIGTLGYRALTARTANIGMLAFTLGWAIHHLFESYTLLQWTAPAVLSALTLGYLLVGAKPMDTNRIEPSGGG